MFFTPTILYKNYKSMNSVININNHQIYVGDYTAAQDIKLLKNKNIIAGNPQSQVLTAGSGLCTKYKKSDNIIHKTLNALDSPTFNLAKFFDQSYVFLDQCLQKGNVLVHCAAGISRSSTIVISYMMRKLKLSLEKCLQICRQKRPVINPNPGFMRQLRNLEKEIKEYKLKANKINELQRQRIEVENFLFNENKDKSIQDWKLRSIKKKPQRINTFFPKTLVPKIVTHSRY